MRRWSGRRLQSCILCCPSTCRKDEPLTPPDIQQAGAGLVEEPIINDSLTIHIQQAVVGHVEEPIDDSHNASPCALHGEASLIDTQIRQLALKEQQLPPLSLHDLDVLLDLVTAQVESLQPNVNQDATKALMRKAISEYAKREEVVTSFIQSLPKEVIKKVVGGSKDVLMPLLTNVFRGMGNLQWVGLGLRLIGWSLDNMDTTKENSKECLEILQDAVDLMKKTKNIWVQSKRKHEDSNNPDLQKTIEIAFRCVIVCNANMQNRDVVRFIDAQRVKGAIADLKQELRDAKFNNVSYMVTDLHGDASNVARQVSFTDDCCNDRVGGDEGIHEAMEYLMKDCDDMIGVCLHGMGGIGKSFMGLEIYKEIQKSRRLQQGSPYRDCRAELQLDIKVEKLVDIQKQILQKICGVDASGIFDCTEGRDILRKGLNKIKDPIFLYLDNVLEPLHLVEILPKASCFPKGSKLLVTSRGVHIASGIKRFGIQDTKLIEVKKMQEKQAKELLWKQIYDSEEQSIGAVSTSGALEKLEKQVLKLCGGLPLALKVVGGYIGSVKRGASDERVWQDVVNAMEKAEPVSGEAHDELYSRISFSIKNLHPSIKRAFLDIVSFYKIGTPWKRIKRLVGRHRLETLHQRALVQKTASSSIYQKFRLIKVHDVFHSLAMRMIKEDIQELRITGTDNLKQHYGNLEKVVALNDVKVEACLLKQMPLLRFLRDVDVEGEGEEATLRHLSVVDGLISRKVKLFNFDGCDGLKEVSWRGAEENAADLEFLRHQTLSKELEFLQIERWRQLKNVDVIDTLRSLKHLSFYDCSELSYLPEGIGSLTKLEVLRLNGCESLQSLPNGVTSLACLKTLELFDCKSLQSLPEGIGSLTRLTRLNLGDCTALHSLQEIKSLTGLKSLRLPSCEGLYSLMEEGAFSMLGNMVTGVELSWGRCRQYLPHSIASFTGLRSLTFEGCGSLEHLPEELAMLTGLTRLTLTQCESVQSLPQGITSLMHLTAFQWDKCRSLQALPQGMAQYWTCLKRLTLQGWSGLEPSMLLEEIWKMAGLETLELTGWENIQALVPGAGIAGLRRLRWLGFRECTSLVCVPEAVTRLTRLRHLGLGGCKSLKCLPQGLSSMVNCEVRLAGCTSLLEKVDKSCPEELMAGRLSHYPNLFQAE